MLVVHQADQRLFLGDVGEQAQHRQPDEKPIGRRPRTESEGCPQCVTLRHREALEAIQHRSQQLMQAGERKLHLRLDTRGAHDTAARRLLGDVVQQRRLPHPRLAAQHHRPALACAHSLDERVECVGLSAPARQPCRAPSDGGNCGHLPATEGTRPPAGCDDWRVADAKARLRHDTDRMSRAAVHIRSPRLAVLGAGHVGPVIARVATEAGYGVMIAASAGPERIALITRVLAPGAEPRWAADAVGGSDVVVLAIPIHKFAAFDSALVAGKLVVDAMNYWPPVDGVQELFEDRQYGSSEIVQHRLDRATVVKTLNHIGYHELDEQRRPPGSPERRALGVAGDDPGAVDVVAEIIQRIGYDTVRLDDLSAGRLLEPGSPVFGASLRRSEFERALYAEAA